METRELAKQYHFISSPTVRVNGRDICGRVAANNCGRRGDLRGDTADCRTSTYENRTYERSPKALLMDGILRAIYGQHSQNDRSYAPPENLERFFVGRQQK